MASGQKLFYIAIGVVVVAGVAVIASRMTGNHGVAIPANVVVTAGDTSGFHGYVLGSPSAPVEITEYADYECPHCADFDEVQFPDIKTRLIDTGKARWRFRDYPIDGIHKQSRVAAHAAACANDQGHFWDVSDAIFRRQNDWAFHDNPMPVLTDVVKQAGVDVTAWKACMESAKYAGRIQASLNEGTRLGVNGTPTFLIAGQLYSSVGSDRLVQVVDSLIAAGPVAAPAGAPTSSGGQ